jgi:hypothetical protein
MTDTEQILRGLRVERTGAGSLSLGVASGIEALIEAGRLPPGHLLPRTRRLAELLGVSVQVAQEACTRLADRGLVARRRRSGTVVTGRRSTGVVGLLVAVDPTLPQQANPGWIIAQEAMVAAQQYGLELRHYLRCCTTDGFGLPDNLVADLKNRLLDAVLVGAVYADIVRQHVHTPTPVFHLDPGVRGLAESVADAVRWLWRQDVVRPALVLEAVETAAVIESAFVAAAAGFRQAVREGHIVRNSPSRIEQGRVVYDRLMQGAAPPPDGVVIMDDMVGFGFLREIEARGGPDPVRVVVMTNKGSALHIDGRCPQIAIDWGVVVEEAFTKVLAPDAAAVAAAGQPVYRFCPPAPGSTS